MVQRHVLLAIMLNESLNEVFALRTVFTGVTLAPATLHDDVNTTFGISARHANKYAVCVTMKIGHLV